MPIREERRQSARAEIHWPMEIEVPNGIIEGNVKNISADGVFVTCSPIPAPGSIVRIILKPRGYRPIKVTGEIIWTAAAPQVGGGIAFTEILEEDKKFILDAVSNANHAKFNRR